MKVWITKYALTKGISEYEAEIITNNAIVIISDKYKNAWFGKGDWHSDRKSAIAKSEEMRKKKLASLRKQIEKLEKLRFE